MLNYTYVVYLNMPYRKEVIRVSQSSIKYDLPEINFKEYVMKLGETSFKGLLYLCTLYGRKGTADKLFKVYTGKIDYVNSYLKETYGKLIYKFQAFHLLAFYGNCSETKAIRLIRGLHDWDASAYKQAKEIMIEDEYNFYDLWKEYTFEKKVYEPMHTIAHVIFDYFKNEK